MLLSKEHFNAYRNMSSVDYHRREKCSYINSCKFDNIHLLNRNFYCIISQSTYFFCMHFIARFVMILQSVFILAIYQYPFVDGKTTYCWQYIRLVIQISRYINYMHLIGFINQLLIGCKIWKQVADIIRAIAILFISAVLMHKRHTSGMFNMLRKRCIICT